MTTWEEPRGPHLPDRMTAVPAMVWPFVLVAIVVDLLWLQRNPGAEFDADRALPFISSIARTSALALLGAALFLRRPDAWRNLRPIAKAVTLFATAQLLAVGALVTSDLMGQGSSGDAELSTITVGFVVGRLAMAAQLFAIGYLWAGLGAVRRRDNAAGSRVLMVGLIGAAIAIMVIGVQTLVALGAYDGEPIIVAQNLIGTALSGLILLALMALLSELLAGARASEEPRGAWWLGFAGVTLWAIGTSGITWIFDALGTSGPDYEWLVRPVQAAGTAGALLLLVAFLIGLPEHAEQPLDAAEPGELAGIAAA